jgi:hypothetical protein
MARETLLNGQSEQALCTHRAKIKAGFQEGESEAALRSSRSARSSRTSALGPALVPMDRLPARMQQQGADASQSKLYAATEPPSKLRARLFTRSHRERGLQGCSVSGKGRRGSTSCVQAMAECQECSKPRGMFCIWAISQLHKKHVHLSKGYAMKQLDMALEDDPHFVCGAAFLLEGHTLHKVVYTDTVLSCSSALEAALYGAPQRVLDGGRTTCLTALCAQCGVAELTAELMDA